MPRLAIKVNLPETLQGTVNKNRTRTMKYHEPGRVPRPGMVCMSPKMGYKKPAPAESRTARIGIVNPGMLDQ